MDVISLTQDLIKYDTVSPPGNEEEIARFVGNILLKKGFDVEYHIHEDKRLNLIASKGLSENSLPIVFTGHLDVVPLGKKEWSVNPFKSEIIDNKLFGRGSSDMKGGVAAIVIAAIEVFDSTTPKGGVKLIITADEELGCRGAKKLCSTYKNIGKASALVVAEPTSNIPIIGHKGGLYINAKTLGITAHSSMPELGENAIYKAAKAICKLEKFKFNVDKDLLLGYPTLNVGKISGGLNINSVPDKAEFTIDVRSTTKLNNDRAFELLQKELGEDVDLEMLVNLNAISTDENHPFVQMVYEIAKNYNCYHRDKKALSYLTDAAVLAPCLGDVPTIILGPGESTLAHQTDEFCYVDKLEESVEIYKSIIIKNGELNDG